MVFWKSSGIPGGTSAEAFFCFLKHPVHMLSLPVLQPSILKLHAHFDFAFRACARDIIQRCFCLVVCVHGISFGVASALLCVCTGYHSTLLLPISLCLIGGHCVQVQASKTTIYNNIHRDIHKPLRQSCPKMSQP